MQPQYYGAAAEYNKPKRNKLFSGKLLMIIVGVVVFLVLFLLLFTILGAIAGGPKNDLARLAARAGQLQSFIEKNTADIHSSTLQKISAETKLFISTNVVTLKSAYSGELPEGIVASEADTDSTSKLSEAKKTGRFDETYLSILKQKVASILELANKVRSSGGQQTKTAGEQTASNMTVVGDQLANLKL